MDRKKIFLNGRWVVWDHTRPSQNLRDFLKEKSFSVDEAAKAHSELSERLRRRFEGRPNSTFDPLPNTPEGWATGPTDYGFTFNVKWGNNDDAENNNETGTVDFDEDDVVEAFEYKGNAWYAPEGWNVYSCGEISGSHLRIGKGSVLNAKVFELLPFEMIPAC